MQVAELADDDVGAAGEALQGAAQGRQHDFRGVAHARLNAVQQLEQHGGVLADDQVRGQAAQFLFGVGFPGFWFALDLFDGALNAVAVLFYAVGGHANRHVRLEAFFHEVEELVAGLLHQLLRFHFFHQLPFAFFQLGDDVGEVGDDALGMFVGVEQIVDLAAIHEGGQGIEGVTGVAVAGAHAAPVHFRQGLGEQAAGAAERVGGLEGGFVLVPLQPAMLHQQVENPAGLLAVVAKAAAVFVTVQQRRPFQGFAEHIQHLIALE